MRWSIGCLACLCVCGILAGCESNSLLNPAEPKILSKHEPLIVPILKNLDPSVEENDREFVNATGPTAEDRQTNRDEYRISPNDLLSIGISDLVTPGQEQIQTRRVSETGMISLPYIGPIQVEGLTEIELEQTITQTYKDLALIQSANVSVTVVEARGRSFEVLGAVTRPNVYAIPEAEFRLLDALVIGGDVTSPQIDYVYVIRRTTPPRPASRPIRRGPTGGPTTTPTPIPSPGDLSPRTQVPQSGTNPAANSGQDERALKLMADAPPAEAAVANRGSVASTASPIPIPGDVREPVVLAQTSAAPEGQFQFNSPALPSNVRVIRIPYQALHDGDLNYNIAIHPHDVVWVKPLPIGVYYVYGHAARPGVFTLSGQKVTIKQAVGGAGMMDELAVPQRAQIVRRIRPDHEVAIRIDLSKIFAMEEPDVYLKPDDQIIIGTNAVAPFLAALRGAFRITYGFGFLYDRNFAYNNFTGGF